MVKIKENIQVGGFVARNQGDIKDCFSVMKIPKSKGVCGGFAAHNTGRVKSCFSYGNMGSLTGGFIGDGNNNMEDSNCFLYSDTKKKESKLRKLKDSHLGQSAGAIKSNHDLAKLGYDVEKVFQFQSEEAIPISFNGEHWMYDVKNSPRYAEYKEVTPLVISNEKELVTFAQRVNDGDQVAQKAYVVMGDDIDLKGMQWKPIGIDKLTAFSGIFDGAGHTVKNFVIGDKKGEFSGLFGYLNGEIYNLTVDGKITGGKNVGGIAAVCAGGTIGCCACVADIKAKNGAAGGITSLNTGTIFQCYSAGRILTGIKLGLYLAPLLVLAVTIPTIFLAKSLYGEAELAKFAQVPYDNDTVAIVEEEEVEMVTGSNFVSFQFSQEVEVNASTGKCKFDFKNPGNSNHNIVAELQMTDAQAMRVMGSTGRLEKEQTKLEENPSYEPENYRMVLAKSGAIAPGRMLENLTLVEQPNGAGLPDGSYNAVIFLYYYDVETNAKAMLDTQLPVVLKVSR